MSDHKEALIRTLTPFAIFIPVAVFIAVLFTTVPPTIIALILTTGVTIWLVVMLYRDNLATIRRERQQ